MGYRVKPFTMSVRNNSTQEFEDIGLLGSDVDGVISELQNKVTDLEKRKVRNIIILGDSWSDVDQEGGNTKWPAVLENQLPELQIHNYAKGGSRIVGEDNYALNGTVGGQIAAAIADISYDHDYIDTIIIFGGINDFRSESNVNNQYAYNVANDIKAKINGRLRPNFPNADYVYICNNSIPASHKQYMFGKKVCDFLKLLTGCRTYSTIGWVNTGYYNSDHIHPNENGHLLLLGNLKAILFGGNISYVWPNQASVSVTDGTKTVNISLVQSVTENTIITQVTWNCTSTSISNATTMTGVISSTELYKLVYFPEWFATCNIVNAEQNFAMSTIKTNYITAPTLNETRNEVVDGRFTLYTQAITKGVGLGYLISNNNW